jgi:hypothetical protein
MQITEIFSDEDLIGDQDEVFAEYIELIGRKNAEKLYQFFSHTRIPTGLTQTQAMICVNLLGVRQGHLELLEKGKTMEEKCDPQWMTLPQKLVYKETPITEEDFRDGIMEFLDSVASIPKED